MDQEQIVKKYIDAYNTFDIDSMLSLMSDDVKFINISGGEINVQSSGKHDLEKLARQSAEFFKARKQSLKFMNIIGEKVIVGIDFTAVLAKDMPSGLKAGDKISLTGTSEFIIKDGLIESVIDVS